LVLYDGRQQPAEWLGFADVIAQVVNKTWEVRYESPQRTHENASVTGWFEVTAENQSRWRVGYISSR